MADYIIGGGYVKWFLKIYEKKVNFFLKFYFFFLENSHLLWMPKIDDKILAILELRLCAFST